MNKWFEKIGYVLSTSDFESFHLAPVEGMATGSIPIILSWEGADTIHCNKFIYDSIEESVKGIISNSNKIGDNTLRAYCEDNFASKHIFNKILNTILM